jgi:hypothetical protein
MYMATNIDFTAHRDAQGNHRRATRNEFFQGNTVFFYRNPHYTYGPDNGPARIHRLTKRVMSRAQLIPAMNQGEFHYSMTDAIPRDVTLINNSRDLTGFGLPNLGWGYVGINANRIPDIRIRRAIMYVLNPDMTLAYYQGMSTRITRAATTNNWVFQSGGATDFPPCRYPYRLETQVGGGGMRMNAEEVNRIRGLFRDAGYTLSGGTDGTGPDAGIPNIGGTLSGPQGQLRITFSLPGDTTDHPARDMFLRAANMLRRYFGVNANVVPDPQVLTRLATGSLQVWAAAFGVLTQICLDYSICTRETILLTHGALQQ